MRELLEVAKRDESGKLRWYSWKVLPNLVYLKKLYKKKPNLFTEVDGVLYKKEMPNQKYLHTLLNSCLVLAGSRYALALGLSGGNRHGALFQNTYKALSNRRFRDRAGWVEKFEWYIKTHATRVAIIQNDQTLWIEQDEDTAVQTSTLKEYFSRRADLFEQVGNELYYLSQQNILIENMFFRAVELAGGEYELAKTLSNDKRSQDKHLKNFERMTFAQRDNFKYYSDLLGNYLEKNHSLFAEDEIYA